MLYQEVYRPKAEYPLGQIFLTDKQVKKIESASLPTIIAKCGYNRNMALNIRGGPKELGRAGFYAFLNTIGATRVQHFFLKNWRTPNEDIGKVLRIVMVWTQYSAGVPYLILVETKQDLSCVKSRTVLATRKYLHKSRRVIHLDTKCVQHPKQENDVSMMHLVNIQTNRKVKINQKEKINCVRRMCLRVNYVSEICKTDGASFVPGILKVDDCQFNYQTTLTKQSQGKPGEQNWMLWRRILKMLTSAPTTKINRIQ